MRYFILGTAFLALTSYATPVQSASSFGGHTLETEKEMSVFCSQAISDHKATNEPITGELKKLCL